MILPKYSSRSRNIDNVNQDVIKRTFASVGIRFLNNSIFFDRFQIEPEESTVEVFGSCRDITYLTGNYAKCTRYSPRYSRSLEVKRTVVSRHNKVVVKFLCPVELFFASGRFLHTHTASRVGPETIATYGPILRPGAAA